MKIQRKNEQKSHKNKIKDCIFKDKERNEKGKKGKERILKYENKRKNKVITSKIKKKKSRKNNKKTRETEYLANLKIQKKDLTIIFF
jgi:hypothetical protein